MISRGPRIQCIGFLATGDSMARDPTADVRNDYFCSVPNNDETEPPIFTPRLVLHHLSPSRLVTLFEEPKNDVIYRGCDYTNPHRDLIDNPGPLRWRVPQVKEDAALNKWFLRWIVLASIKEIIGSVSFHGAPDNNGMIEIGLGVQPDFQCHGYAKEALIGMWSWAIEQPGVEVLRYTVSATNLASMKIIHGFDFTHVGVQNDKEEGVEEIFEMSAAVFQRRLAAPWRAPSL
jgi:ribosomal-protein-alanine N-acetyltransferase